MGKQSRPWITGVIMLALGLSWRLGKLRAAATAAAKYRGPGALIMCGAELWGKWFPAVFDVIQRKLAVRTRRSPPLPPKRP